MPDFDERTVRWLVNGVASGEPLTAAAAAGALNDLLRVDPGSVSRLRRLSEVANRLLAAEGHPAVVVFALGRFAAPGVWTD